MTRILLKWKLVIIENIGNPGAPAPVRVEFWGDEIDTASYFELESQRRTELVEELLISPATEAPVSDPQGLAAKIDALAASLRSKQANLPCNFCSTDTTGTFFNKSPRNVFAEPVNEDLEKLP